MAVIEPTVDKLNEPTVMLQIRNVAKAVDKNLNAVNDEMTDIQNQINQMEDVSSRVDALEDDMQTAQQAITEIQQKDTEQDTAIQNNENGLVTGTELSYANGQLTLKLARQIGDITDTVDVPFFKTVTLIPTSTERAFKLQFTMWDDSVYDTNEFVIPAGGGTDVSVTGVTVEDGSADNSFKVSIQLSDGTPIDSNDYPFPTQAVSPYPTSATLALSGNTLNLTVGLSNSTNVVGSIDLSPILTGYATTSYVDTKVSSKLDKTTADGYYQPKGDYVTEPAVETINAEIINGNTLKIDVNAKSAQVELPSNGATIGLLNNPPSNIIDNATIRSWIQAYPNSILFISGFVSAQNSGYMKIAIYTKPLTSDPENKATGDTYYQCWGENWISSSNANKTITRLADDGSVIFGLEPNHNGGARLSTIKGSGFRITLN